MNGWMSGYAWMNGMNEWNTSNSLYRDPKTHCHIRKGGTKFIWISIEYGPYSGPWKVEKVLNRESLLNNISCKTMYTVLRTWCNLSLSNIWNNGSWKVPVNQDFLYDVKGHPRILRKAMSKDPCISCLRACV